MQYCTIDDILGIAQDFKRDVVPLVPDPRNTGTIPRADVDAIAVEASDMVNMLLQPRYAIATIEGYSPTFPPVIIYLAATYSAILMHERYGASSVDKNEKLTDRYNRSIIEYKTIIVNGALVDVAGDRVPVQVSPVLKLDTTYFVANTEIKELYEDGRIY